jgi:DNA primase
MDILDLLKQCGIDKRPNQQGNILYWCCFHDHHFKSPSMSINVEKRVFFCWNCGAKGHVRKIFYHYGLWGGNWDNSTDYTSLLDYFDKEFELQEDELNTADEKELQDYKWLHPYLTKRGFDKQFIKANGIGYDRKTLRVTIPVYFKGNYYGCIKRTVVDDIPKYLYPDNFQRSAVLFTPQTVKVKNNKVRLFVEGSIDALKAANYGYLSNSILGCHASQIHIREIQNCSEVPIIALDNDPAGQMGQEKLLKEIKRDDVLILQYPEGIKDIGEMTEKQLDWAVHNASSVWDSLLQNFAF